MFLVLTIAMDGLYSIPSHLRATSPPPGIEGETWGRPEKSLWLSIILSSMLHRMGLVIAMSFLVLFA